MEKILVEDAIEEMLFNDEARGLAVNTIEKHTKFLEMFRVFLIEKQISYINEVEPRHIKAFMLFKYRSSLAESYINSFLRSIRALFNYCENEGYISFRENPLKNVSWMKEEKR